MNLLVVTVSPVSTPSPLSSSWDTLTSPACTSSVHQHAAIKPCQQQKLLLTLWWEWVVVPPSSRPPWRQYSPCGRSQLSTTQVRLRKLRSAMKSSWSPSILATGPNQNDPKIKLYCMKSESNYNTWPRKTTRQTSY